MSFKLTRLDFQQDLDYLEVNGYMLSGTATTIPVSTPFFSVATPSPIPMRIVTNHEIQRSGVILSAVSAACNSGGGAAFYTIGLNSGVDGVLLHTNDNAYVSFYLPANREAFINLDHDFSGTANNFDMYATVGSGNFGTSCATSAFCAYTNDATGEVIHIPAQVTSRTIKLNIHARGGQGRYRLFVASPVATFSEDVDIAYDGNVQAGSAADTRAKGIWGRTQQLMLSATDGQYRIRAHALVTRDVSCFSCYDLVFSEADEVHGCVNGVTATSFFGSYIEIPRGYWRGESSSCHPTPAAAERVAETVTHEWGHHEFELCDEYGDSILWCNPGGSGRRCGFSLMAASWRANFESQGNNHWEFCGDSDHGLDPEPGQAPAGGDSAWDDICEEYSQMSMPSHSPDFSRLKALGQRMSQGQFVSFSGP